MTLRDRVLGRIAVAQHCAQEIADSLDATMAHFVETDEDMKGKERRELLEQAQYGAHLVATAVDDALTAMADMTRDDIEEDEGFGQDDEVVDPDD